MAYQKVTNVASMDAVLGYLSTFIGTLGGFTIDNNLGAPVVATGGGGRLLIAHAGDLSFCLRSGTAVAGIQDKLILLAGLIPFGGTDDSNFNGNPGDISSGSYSNGGLAGGAAILNGFCDAAFPGPFPTLYMFSDTTTYVHIVVEVLAGVFRHMLLGNLTKFGTWTGGAYYSGMRWNQTVGFINQAAYSQHMPPFDNNNSITAPGNWLVHYEHGGDKWITPGGDAMVGTTQRREARGSVRGGMGHAFKNIQESLFSGLIPLTPVLVGAVRTSDTPITDRWIGKVPDWRMVNMTNLTAAQEIAIGADTWKCFPMAAKNGLAGFHNSGVAGFAYKKIP